MVVFKSLALGLALTGLAWIPAWAGVSNTSTSPSIEWANDNVQSMRTFWFQQAHGPTLKVYIQPGYPQYGQYVASGLTQWSQALGGRLQAVTTDRPEEAHIKVYWVNGFSDPSQAGETEFTQGEATLYIKTRDIPSNLVEGNILHELGHALGIAGHSHCNEDIMMTGRAWRSLAEYRSYKAQLTQRDVDAIRRLYSAQWVSGEDLYAPSIRQASGFHHSAR